MYGKEQTVQYMLASTGMPEGSYNVDVAYAPELLDDYVAGGTVIPESSFEIINPKVEFKTQNLLCSQGGSGGIIPRRTPWSST